MKLLNFTIRLLGEKVMFGVIYIIGVVVVSLGAVSFVRAA